MPKHTSYLILVMQWVSSVIWLRNRSLLLFFPLAWWTGNKSLRLLYWAKKTCSLQVGRLDISLFWFWWVIRLKFQPYRWITSCVVTWLGSYLRWEFLKPVFSHPFYPFLLYHPFLL